MRSFAGGGASAPQPPLLAPAPRHRNRPREGPRGGCREGGEKIDPAREGLHPDVIKALRSTKEIQRLVYVSCNPTGSLVKDTAMLCCPATKKYKGLPFKPTRAQPVDMFPLTPHCEMVMTFDRMTAEEAQGELAKETVKATEQDQGKTEGSEEIDAKETTP